MAEEVNTRKPARVTVLDLIRVLTGLRRERFPNEKYVAWMTFCAWAYFPNDEEGIVHAYTVSLANLFEKSKQSIRQRLLSDLPILRLTGALLRPPHTSTYSAAMEGKFRSAMGMADIISFFMHCPQECNPSLLKALYFLDEGGLLNKGEWSPEELKGFKRSPTTLKLIWNDLRVSGFFHYVAHQECFSFDDLSDFAPDSPTAIRNAKRFFAHQEDVEMFFQIARFCQERVVSRLDDRSKIKFVRYPNAIDALDIGFGTFDEPQLQLLKKYRAPKQLPDDDKKGLPAEIGRKLSS